MMKDLTFSKGSIWRIAICSRLLWTAVICSFVLFGLPARTNAQDLWQQVGSVGFSAGSADYTSLAIDSSGTPYVAYQDRVNGKAATPTPPATSTSTPPATSTSTPPATPTSTPPATPTSTPPATPMPTWAVYLPIVIKK